MGLIITFYTPFGVKQYHNFSQSFLGAIVLIIFFLVNDYCNKQILGVR